MPSSAPITVMSITPAVKRGHLFFVKRSTTGAGLVNDEIYICFKGGTPSVKNYDLILTDIGSSPGPVVDIDGFVAGEIKAVSSTGTGVLSTTFLFEA